LRILAAPKGQELLEHILPPLKVPVEARPRHSEFLCERQYAHMLDTFTDKRISRDAEPVLLGHFRLRVGGRGIFSLARR
jgi:hypothetical protein